METDRKLLWPVWILAGLGAIALLYVAHDFFIPLLVGIVLTYMLRPAVDALVSIRLPRTLASIVVVGITTAACAWGIYSLADEATQLLETLPKAVRTVRVAIQDGRAEQPAAISKVREAANELDKAAAAATGQRAPSSQAPSSTPSVGSRLQEYMVAKGISFFFLLGQALFALLLATYLLSEGDTFKRKMLTVVGPSLTNRKVILRILDDIDRQIQRHMLSVCAANALIGFATAGIFAMLGMENPVLWGVLSALFHFIPYVGQAIITGFSTAAAYLQFGEVSMALAVMGTTLAISIVIGTVLMTWLQSRASRVNTTLLFVVMLFLGWLWGAWGLVLASPVIAIVKSICDHVPAFAPAAAFLAADKVPEPAEPAESPAA
ncbi:AI-2E family transporter [Usitatibacter palustris]|uniref:AI-2E family transporter n=1 Tax=Usitatibacter palustris TaxID=2732487 RepID=A0A6M4H1T6_9PROT|nr:AI-2E family transporter [Usitatibacter palustris]QJR13469.1 hypothetical protein DSM104440_00253 [Usitatibacter palustris]